MTSSAARKIAATCAVLGLATIGVAAAPKPANAWWNGYGYGYGWGYVPPVVVAPPPAYYPPRPTTRLRPTTPRPPAPGSRRTGEDGYWVPGHWS